MLTLNLFKPENHDSSFYDLIEKSLF